MKKEVGTYFSVGILVLLGLFTVWVFNAGLTGYAVYQESSQSDFNLGTYSNTYHTGSAVSLSENQTTGTYISKIFDGSVYSNWDNITTQGTTPEGTSVSFEVRACSASDCSGSNFASASDLNDLNLMGKYFQYKATFTGTSSVDNNTNITTYTSPTLTSVSSGYGPVVASATISQPAGVKTSPDQLPITYTLVASPDAQCIYNIKNSTDSIIKENSSIDSCDTDLVFDLSAGEGSYTFNLFVTSSSGNAQANSSFSIDLPASQEDTEDEESETEETPAEEVLELPAEPPAQPAPVTATAAISLTSNDIQPLTGLNPGKTQALKWTIINSGSDPLSSCKIAPTGSFASWVTADDMSVNLNAGESKEFNLNVNVPTTAADATNTITMSATCFETSTTKDFTVNVVNKKLLLDVISTDRTRASRVRVVYSLEELLGTNQNVTLKFFLFDANGVEISNITQNKTIKANLTNDYSANLPINKSLAENTTLNLQVNYNSEVYSDTVNQPLTLSAPISGFALLGDGLGTGGIAIVAGAIAVLVIGFFVVRAMRKGSK